MNIRKVLSNLVMPPPLPESKHYRRTVMWPDCMGQQPISDGLIELALAAGQRARTLRLSLLDERCGPDGQHNTWPGEHYRLLAALVDILKPASVVEFGTYAGLSSLAMKVTLPAAGAKISTFDLVSWREIPGTLLRAEDFYDGRLVQHLDNLADPAAVEKNRDLLENADLFFIDGPKDGVTEPKLFANLSSLNFKRTPIFVIDDIHDYKFLDVWDAITHPKYDITSFGHWAGTGLVRWGGRG